MIILAAIVVGAFATIFYMALPTIIGQLVYKLLRRRGPPT